MTPDGATPGSETPQRATPRRTTPERATVLQGARRKAYRPLPSEAIAAAVDEALAAYERDDWFEAHELLEPAWMGTADRGERELYQGLIKLAAGCVHRIRGNRLGMTKNLRGAHARLAGADEAAARRHGIGLAAVIADIDASLAALATDTPLDAVPVPRLR